jgi:transaldolase
MANPLLELTKHGQSVWYDNLNRELLVTGRLQEMVNKDGVSGGTSNPSIFQKALAASDVYDGHLGDLVRQGLDIAGIYDGLTVTDVQMSAGVFRPVYDDTQGADGYASLEVSPDLAYDTEASIEAARRLFRALGRPNAMIKIPGTNEGLPAVELCLAEGLNINITLLFSVEVYEKVAWAYISALEKRAERGERVDAIGSVASFFVSRVDTLTDKKLEEKIEAAENEQERQKLRDLQGKAGIANARIAYQKYKEIFSSPRWQKLEAMGARPQRCLWASTSTKNPNYRDVMYVEELIGPNTINTMPQETLDAFRGHGVVSDSLERDVEAAFEHMERLAELGIGFRAVTDELQKQGVDLFCDSFHKAVESIKEKVAWRQGGGLMHRPLTSGRRPARR